MTATAPTRRLVLLAVAALVVRAAPARADDDDDDDHDDDHERALRAVAEGKALPLAAILAKLAGQIDGEVIEVELKAKTSRLVYEIKVLDKAGRVHELYVDAATGKTVSAKAR